MMLQKIKHTVTSATYNVIRKVTSWFKKRK